tara:strand:+ start:291 stop:779 length:489 start_codon:yes stop_codon:yes gene_type:complete
MQFKSKQYINSVESFASNWLNGQKKLAIICVKVMCHADDLNTVLTSSGMINANTNAGIREDVASCGGQVSRSAIDQAWKAVVQPNVSLDESGDIAEWDADVTAMEALCDDVQNGKVAITPERKAASNGGKRSITAVDMLEKVEKMSKKERNQFITALNLKYS